MAQYEWQGNVNVSLPEFVKQETVNTFRSYMMTALMEKRGRIIGGHSGVKLEWPVRVHTKVLTPAGDASTYVFQRHNKWEIAELPWRRLTQTEMIYRRDIKLNAGKSARIKLVATTLEAMMADAKDEFGLQFYVDGNAAGNTQKYHGIESFMGNSGAAGGGFIGTPSDTYATLSTTLGGLGGSLTSGTWPQTAINTPDYDAWSPIIVDYTDSLWTAGTDTWANTCTEAMRFGIVHSKRNASKTGTVDYIVLDRELYRQFLNHEEAKEQIQVVRGKETGLVALGFNAVQFEGVEVATEYGVTADVGYGINVDAVQLNYVGDEFWHLEGPEYDPTSDADLYLLTNDGNYQFNPRQQFKLVAIT